MGAVRFDMASLAWHGQMAAAIINTQRVCSTSDDNSCACKLTFDIGNVLHSLSIYKTIHWSVMGRIAVIDIIIVVVVINVIITSSWVLWKFCAGEKDQCASLCHLVPYTVFCTSSNSFHQPNDEMNGCRHLTGVCAPNTMPTLQIL